MALPALPAGTHRLRIDATTPGRTPALADSLVRTIAVVDTRTVRSHLTSAALTAGTTVGGADGTTTVTLVDAGRGRVVPLLQAAAIAEPYRADAAIAASVARDLLADGFGIADDPGLPEPAPQLFQVDGGIAVVPYGSPDLELSALAALAGDRRLDPQSLRRYLAGVQGDDGAPLTPSRALFRLLGRAALGDATLAEVREAAATTAMTVPERVTVTLAALAVGDEPLARSLYAGILSDAGERSGPWVRVQAGSPEETAVATARLAIVGAALGDPLAARMDAEVDAHPPTDTLVVLERVVAAARWAHRIPPASATAAITIDGARREVTTTADEPVQLTVTPAQRRTLRIDPVNGSIIVTARWDGPVAAGDLAPPAGQSIDRTIAPASPIDPTRTVVVTFTVKLGPKADGGCWLVTDLAPSGLAPIGGSPRREARGEEDPGAVEPDRGSVARRRAARGLLRDAGSAPARADPALSRPGRHDGHVPLGAGGAAVHEHPRSGRSWSRLGGDDRADPAVAGRRPRAGAGRVSRPAPPSLASEQRAARARASPPPRPARRGPSRRRGACRGSRGAGARRARPSARRRSGRRAPPRPGRRPAPPTGRRRRGGVGCPGGSGNGSSAGRCEAPPAGALPG